MSIFHQEQERQDSLPADRVLCPDSLDRALLDVATDDEPDADADADGWWRVPLLGRRGELPSDSRWGALAREASAEALPSTAAGMIDAEAVAEWITSRYRKPRYSAVLLGAPHGAAVHLAAAMDAAWLPTSFPVTLEWPGGAVGDWGGAMQWGAELAARIMERNPEVTVRQVHDPVLRGPLCGTTVTLRLRWRSLPRAYAVLLRERLLPGGASFLLRDLRTWPVLEGVPGHTFQIGTPAAGWAHADYQADLPAFRHLLDGIGVQRWARPYRGAAAQYAETAGDPAIGPRLREHSAAHDVPTHRLLYGAPELLSACVADLYRDRLRPGPGQGRHCVVETGRMLDPRGLLRRGLVPYWCESASLAGVAAAEWWLAGSEQFDEITVLPEPPGTDCGAHAELVHWRSLAAFAAHYGRIDRLTAGRYPMLPLSPRHAARVVGDLAAARKPPPPMKPAEAMAALRASASALGILIG
jgi:hypothetical protein